MTLCDPNAAKRIENWLPLVLAVGIDESLDILGQGKDLLDDDVDKKGEENAYQGEDEKVDCPHSDWSWQCSLQQFCQGVNDGGDSGRDGKQDECSRHLPYRPEKCSKESKPDEKCQ